MGVMKKSKEKSKNTLRPMKMEVQPKSLGCSKTVLRGKFQVQSETAPNTRNKKVVI